MTANNNQWQQRYTDATQTVDKIILQHGRATTATTTQRRQRNDDDDDNDGDDDDDDDDGDDDDDDDDDDGDGNDDDDDNDATTTTTTTTNGNKDTPCSAYPPLTTEQPATSSCRRSRHFCDVATRFKVPASFNQCSHNNMIALPSPSAVAATQQVTDVCRWWPWCGVVFVAVRWR